MAIELKSWHQRNKEAVRERRYKYRLQVLTYYGKGKLACIKCNFSDVRALCLDHINSNNKNLIRRTTRGEKSLGIESYFREFIKQDFPDGYQTLCANCNLIKAVENKEL